MENVQKEKIGIENIEIAIETIINIIKNITQRKQLLEVVLGNLPKAIGIKFRAIGKEIKDIDPTEREQLVNLIIANGFPKLNAEKVINNLGNGRKLKPLLIARELLKK